MSTVADITSELDDHGFADTLTTRKVAIINDVVADVCSREPWPFLVKNLTLTFSGNAYASNWPADFRQVDEGGITDPSTGAIIQWERRGTLKKRFANSLNTPGTPSWYYFLARRAQFLPVPLSGYTLDMDYLAQHPTLLSTSIETDILIPANHHRVLVLGALLRLYSMEDDPENAALFGQQYEGRISTMREELSRLQYDRPDRIIVLQDDWDF